MPSSKKELFNAATKRADKFRAKGKEIHFDLMLRGEPDGGMANVYNISSSHWKRWLGVESRCPLPFKSCSEFDWSTKQDVGFAFGDEWPTAFVAGI